MKKILLLISLFVLMITVVSAAETIDMDASIVSVNDDGAHDYRYTPGGECVFYPLQNSYYCFKNTFLIKINMVDYTTTEIYGFGTPMPAEREMFGWSGSCEVYNDLIYCFGAQINNPPRNLSFSYDPVGDTFTDLAQPSTEVTSWFWGSCDLMPVTDEVYCWGLFGEAGDTERFMKYDIGDDAWTQLALADYPDDPSWEYTHCEFRPGTDELWCAGGSGYTGGAWDKIWVYDVSANTVDFSRTFPQDINGGTCRWYNDVFLCYAYDNYDDTVYDTVVYYDPSDGSTGYLTETLPAPISGYGTCDEYDGDTDFCIGAYGGSSSSWADYKNIIKIDWSVTPDPFPYDTSIVGTTPIDYDVNNCVLVGETFYCLGYDKKLYGYDTTTNTYFDTGHIYMNVSEPTPKPAYSGWAMTCDEYNNEIYCTGRSQPGTFINIFKYSPLNNFEVTWLDGGSDDMVQDHEDCEFRPGTDEFWCYGWEIGTSYYAIRYYDVSADDWVDVNDEPKAQYDTFLDAMTCAFRNSNEFWCYGGNDNSLGAVQDDIMKYEIDTDTVTYYDTGLPATGAFCRWYNDGFVCYGGDYGAEEGIVALESFIFNPGTETLTIYQHPFEIPILALQSCSEYDYYTDYCVPGYIDGFAYDTNVEKVTYGVAPIPDEPVRRTGGGSSNVVVQSNILKAQEAKKEAAQEKYNVVERFLLNFEENILNFRAAILRFFGRGE